MRRLPVYFLLDVSESMVGEPIQEMQEGLRAIIQDLRQDPYALETVFVSVIAFAGKAHSLSPLEELYKFYPLELPIGDGTSLGQALDYLMQDLDKSICKTTPEQKGDFKPIIFAFTDGVPTDDPSLAIERWNRNYRKHCNLIIVALGENTDLYILNQISDNVLCLKETDLKSFREFFKWVSASIKTSSISVSDYSDDDVKLAPIHSINLEKIKVDNQVNVDENYVVLLGKCSTTGRLYLIKFRRALKMKYAGTDFKNIHVDSTFNLIGAYPINAENYQKFSGEAKSKHKIRADQLVGLPTCPCCGQQIGLVVCGSCDKVSCYGGEGLWECPWCGMCAEVVAGDGSFDLVREKG
ncbi:MAG: VWA domain-containing protein [Desulfovibrionaceae bacterium]|nr:VWA domain-containing protein [Desulfovibrionaceae bacterium]